MICAAALLSTLAGCGKSGSDNPAPPAAFSYSSASVNGSNNGGFEYNRLNMQPIVRISFSAPVNRSTVAAGVSFNERSGGAVTYQTSYASGDSVLIVQPQAALKGFTQYAL